MKKCNKCGIKKESIEFYKAKKVKSGLTSQCKQCLKETLAKKNIRPLTYYKITLEDLNKASNEENLNFYQIAEKFNITIRNLAKIERDFNLKFRRLCETATNEIIKACYICKIEKHKSFFFKNKNTKDGLDILCKPCHNKQKQLKNFKPIETYGLTLPELEYSIHEEKLNFSQILYKYKLHVSVLRKIEIDYNLKIDKNKIKDVNGEIYKVCNICNELLHMNEFSLDGKTNLNKHSVKKSFCKKCKRNRVEHLQARKQTVLDFFGGGCFACPYNRCLRAISFHHLPNFIKMESPSVCFANYTNENLVKEIKKCIPLCHNCHHELHDNFLNIEDLLLNKNEEYILALKKLEEFGKTVHVYNDFNKTTPLDIKSKGER